MGDFLEAVENAAFLGNLDPDDFIKIMPVRLRGPANSFYGTFLARDFLKHRRKDPI